MKARAWLSVAVTWAVVLLLEIAGQGHPLRMAVIAVAGAAAVAVTATAVLVRRVRGQR